MHTKYYVPLALLSLALTPLTQPVPVRAQTPVPQAITKPTLSVLHSFTQSDGQLSQGLTVGADGALYGSAAYGGATDGGTVFKVTRGGLFHKLADLYTRNGISPEGPLLLMPDGSLMGTAFEGSGSGGALFLLTPPHRFQTKHEFKGGIKDANAGGPGGPLALGPDRAVYGTTEQGGGRLASGAEGGVAYRWTAARGLEVVHSFSGTDGNLPLGVVLGPDGALYGVTLFGGGGGYSANGNGAVYRLTLDGTYTVLHAFTSGADGGNPYYPPVPGPDGALYGTTSFGGQYVEGTAYRVTPDGVFTVLHSFGGSGDGSSPSGLTLGPDGNLYGTNREGGPKGGGTVFRLTPKGQVTMLYAFTAGNGGFEGGLLPNGFSPSGGVTFGADGALYGTTSNGGQNSMGTVFKLRLP